ncbi:hypothetical protein [Chitinophaga vietnamensis]|uniref:hypothetical protein n=1 Tax=Chitinophaga vietnamensis TaxID=2593957 RepID=UPI001178151C|nr:hypothetical protein [Chitinophaga vietnamensis]
MRKTLFALCMLLSSAAFSQKSEARKALAKYKIDPHVLDQLSGRHTDGYAFDLKTTTVADGTQKVEIARHDPAKAKEAQWALVSVNGGHPSGDDQSAFRKAHGQHIPPQRPDSNTYKVVKDDGHELVISYQYDPASLVSDNAFLKQSQVKLFFNVQTGRLVRSESAITKPFKIKLFSGERMNSAASYVYMDKEQVYLPVHEEIAITLSLLGRSITMLTKNDYSGYRKP